MPIDSGGGGGYKVTYPKITPPGYSSKTGQPSSPLIKQTVQKMVNGLMSGSMSQGMGQSIMRSQYGAANTGAGVSGNLSFDQGYGSKLMRDQYNIKTFKPQTAWDANAQYDASAGARGLAQMRNEYNNVYGGIGAGGSSAATRFGEGIAKQRQQYQEADIGAGGTKGYTPSPQEINSQGLAQKRDEYNALSIGAGGGLFNTPQSMYDFSGGGSSGGGGGWGFGGGGGGGGGSGAGSRWTFGDLLWRI